MSHFDVYWSRHPLVYYVRLTLFIGVLFLIIKCKYRLDNSCLYKLQGMKLFTQVCVIHLNVLCVGLIVSENCHVSPPQDFTSQIAADVNVSRKVPSYCRHNNTWRQIYNFYLQSECQGYHRVFSKNLMFLQLRTWQMANSYISSTLCFCS